MIVEDGAFIGSRCILTEGVSIGEGAVLAPNVVADRAPCRSSTSPAPSRSSTAATCRRARSSCPGTRPKEFPAGTYQLACALIIGRRDESTDLKVSLNDALREYGIGS